MTTTTDLEQPDVEALADVMALQQQLHALDDDNRRLRLQLAVTVQDALDAGWSYRKLAARLGVTAGAIIAWRAYGRRADARHDGG